MGFQHMKEVVHKAASSKGGRVKTDKGLAKLTPEDRKSIAVLGGKARHEDQSPETQNSGANGGGDSGTPVLADLFGDIDDEKPYKTYSRGYEDQKELQAVQEQV